MLNGMRVLLCLFVVGVLAASSFAAGPDRIKGDLAEGGPRVTVQGNVHRLANPKNDLGRADAGRLMEGITLAFHPSEAQQKDLDQFMAQVGNPSSPNYRKYLTPKEFGRRFGMSSNDLNKVIAWLQSQGFTNIAVANSRNQVSFDGNVAEVESAFGVEMHHYLVNGVIHLANATAPSVPAALSGAVVNISGLHSFAPKPRVKAVPHFTSYISGNHFMSPRDFATIYDLQSLYSRGIDGTGQKIAVVGQSLVVQSDINNFRSAAELPANTVTMTLVPGTSTAAKCSGDEDESDLDLEWSGGLAKNASIIFLYAGLGSGDTCGGARANSVWNALQYAVDSDVAPIISTSYGDCESGNGQAFALQVQGWAQQGITQGQTIVGPAGDTGAADCEATTSTSATTGLAVDMPASIPEVTGAGGTEFSADSQTNTAPGADPPYWAAATSSTQDLVSSALEYIPEEAWNETAAAGTLAASGGGASLYFAKPIWQAGTGVPNDHQRDVPDIAINSAAGHDPYLICTEDTTLVPNGQCTAGFRDGAGGNLGTIGGTSVAAPTFAAVLALVNQSMGNTPPTGLAPVNPRLYQLASSYPTVFNDVTTGNNDVPCTSGTTNCPSGTTSIGFSAGKGYDQVTGLGSVNGATLAQDFAAAGFMLTPDAPSYQVAQGLSATATITVTSLTGFTGNISYTCSDAVTESTCTGPTPAVPSSKSASFSITTTAPTARLDRPFGRGSQIFYATFLPGLLGVVFLASSRKRSGRAVRILGMMMVLGSSTMWLGSCGGSSRSSTKDPGTPVGTYTITVTGTSGSLTSSATFQLVVVQ